jgi:hypothetical protein
LQRNNINWNLSTLSQTIHGDQPHKCGVLTQKENRNKVALKTLEFASNAGCLIRQKVPPWLMTAAPGLA